jgi:hypothetical protein
MKPETLKRMKRFQRAHTPQVAVATVCEGMIRAGRSTIGRRVRVCRARGLLALAPVHRP